MKLTYKGILRTLALALFSLSMTSASYGAAAQVYEGMISSALAQAATADKISQMNNLASLLLNIDPESANAINPEFTSAITSIYNEAQGNAALHPALEQMLNNIVNLSILTGSQKATVAQWISSLNEPAVTTQSATATTTIQDQSTQAAATTTLPSVSAPSATTLTTAQPLMTNAAPVATMTMTAAPAPSGVMTLNPAATGVAATNPASSGMVSKIQTLDASTMQQLATAPDANAGMLARINTLDQATDESSRLEGIYQLLQDAQGGTFNATVQEAFGRLLVKTFNNSTEIYSYLQQVLHDASDNKTPLLAQQQLDYVAKQMLPLVGQDKGQGQHKLKKGHKKNKGMPAQSSDQTEANTKGKKHNKKKKKKNKTATDATTVAADATATDATATAAAATTNHKKHKKAKKNKKTAAVTDASATGSTTDATATTNHKKHKKAKKHKKTAAKAAQQAAANTAQQAAANTAQQAVDSTVAAAPTDTTATSTPATDTTTTQPAS